MIKEIAGCSIKKQINTGSMSKVYLAFDNKLKRNVAVKILSPAYSRESRVTRRFVKEARTAAQLQHSNIISIFNVGKEKNYYFIVMENLRETLGDKIKRGSLKNSIIDILMITRDIASALSYSHRRGFIHRDIKPDNIMFRADGTVVVADFGIVKALRSGSNLTKTGMSVGTPKYMSPEQIRARKVDARSDIYSLGIVFFEMLTGKPPYNDPDIVKLALKHTKGPIPQLPGKLDYLQPLLNKMVAKTPGTRVRDCEGLIRLIDAIIFRIKDQKTDILKKYSEKSYATKSGKMKKVKKDMQTPFLRFTLILIIFLIFFSIYLIKESSSRKEDLIWNKTKNSDSIEAYSEFLSAYPYSKYTQLANETIENMKLKKKLFEMNLKSARDAFSERRFEEALDYLKEAEMYGKKNKIFNSLMQKLRNKIK